MAGFFTRLAPGFYRSNASPLHSEADGEAWARDYERALAREEPFHLLVHARHHPSQAAGHAIALWMEANSARLARLVKMAVYVVECPEGRRFFRQRTGGAEAPHPHPVRIASDFAEAFALCLSETIRPAQAMVIARR